MRTHLAQILKFANESARNMNRKICRSNSDTHFVEVNMFVTKHDFVLFRVKVHACRANCSERGYDRSHAIRSMTRV